MPLRSLPAVMLLLALGFSRVGPVHAGAVIVANRCGAKVEFTMTWPEGEVRRQSLAPGDLVPIPVSDRVEIELHGEEKPVRCVARAGSLYYFVTEAGSRQLRPIAVASPDDEHPQPPATPPKRITTPCTIAVKLLVDDDEPAKQPPWERRLRKRLDEASAVFMHHCRVRFRVVAVETWESDDAAADFDRLLQEFRRKVDPAPARLAIGLTSQYAIPRPWSEPGGAPGALAWHILLPERSQQVTEARRLELLVHALGHFLGAAHNADPASVMCPAAGGPRERATAIRFDPPNALAMFLLNEEIQMRQVQSLGDVSAATKARLDGIYRMLGDVPPQQAEPAEQPDPLVEATKSVLQAIVDAARTNHRRAEPLAEDRLTEAYVRHAAAAADKLPAELGPKAFLLGLGIALDDSILMRLNPLTAGLWLQVETARQRTDRLEVLESPTMRGRNDLAKHFVLSAALTAALGPQRAEAAGLFKELNDMRTGTGLSFVDLTADLAGIAFAERVLDGKLPLHSLATSFAVDDFLPPCSELRENVLWKQFKAEYGSFDADRFRREKDAIRRRVLALPGYARRSRPE